VHSHCGQEAQIVEDDDGICQMTHDSHGWTMSHLALALLEMKKAFKAVYHGRACWKSQACCIRRDTGPIPGQALAAWRTN
jgi:hypothetical protein